MNRNGLLLAALAVLAATGAYAQAVNSGGFKLSAGVGAYFTSDFGGGYKLLNYNDVRTFPYQGGGGYVFFDMTYAEVSIGVFTADGNAVYAGSSSTNYYNEHPRVGYDISLLGKWPYVVDERLTLFALAGINYRGITSYILGGKADSNPDEFSALWFRLGLGLDYAITPRLFARVVMAYGMRPANDRETNTVSEYESFGSPGKTLYADGLDFKIAVGWRF